MTAREIFGEDADFVGGGESDEMLEQCLARFGEEGGRQQLREMRDQLLKIGPGCPPPEVSE